jgi:hypothetical protein
MWNGIVDEIEAIEEFRHFYFPPDGARGGATPERTVAEVSPQMVEIPRAAQTDADANTNDTFPAL